MTRRAFGVLGCMTLLLVTVASSLSAQVKVDAGHRATPDCFIRLQGPVAIIRVIGWDRDSIAISGSLPKGARFDNMFGSETGPVRGMKMLVEGPPGQIRPAGIIELRVPVGATVVLQSGSADIEATKLTGELDITMLGGSAHITGSPRFLTVDAIYATITLDGSPDRVRLKSMEGDITMRGGSSNGEFSTVKGNIRVGGGMFDHATFDATTGSVAFSGDLTRNASFAITTHSASVELQLSPKASVLIKATTSMGTIENLLTKAVPSLGPEGKGQELRTEIGKATAPLGVDPYKGKGQEVRTEIGKGTAQVVVDSYKGSVRLLRRND